MSSSAADRQPADLLRGDLADGTADDGILGGGAAQRRRTETEKSYAATGHAVIVVQLDRDSAACDREIPVPAGELFNRKARPRAPHRKAHSSEDLVGVPWTSPTGP